VTAAAAEWQPELGTDGPSCVLVAVDGSDTALRAGAWAIGLARRNQARLEVVTVAAGSGLAGLNPSAAQALRESEQELADDLRGRLQSITEELGVTMRFWARNGEPLHEIVAIADEVRADVVVVGASQQAGHRLVGSLAVRLVRHGRWPVTVVP
jgi:nucleotide-binding universal stress UspA family protein